MRSDKKNFWLSLCLANLLITALLGFTLRSKILFELPSVNFRNFLSAHSHFAFGGWAGLTLLTLLIYNVLPPAKFSKRIYQWILWGTELSALGMAFTFPFVGYTAISILFSSLYIVALLVFAWIFSRDVLSHPDANVKWLAISAMIAMLLSFLGPLGLSWILLAQSANPALYRDCLYTFLHFQYNGFFTLSVFALYFNSFSKMNLPAKRPASYTIALCFSVVPSLFLALLWHNRFSFYVIAAVGSLLS